MWGFGGVGGFGVVLAFWAWGSLGQFLVWQRAGALGRQLAVGRDAFVMRRQKRGQNISCFLTFFKFLSFCDGLGRFLGHLLILYCVFFSFVQRCRNFSFVYHVPAINTSLVCGVGARAYEKKPVESRKMWKMPLKNRGGKEKKEIKGPPCAVTNCDYEVLERFL